VMVPLLVKLLEHANPEVRSAVVALLLKMAEYGE
jgi:hypothetical protein